MVQKVTRQYGLWESPITPGSLAGDTRLNDVQWDPCGRALVWTEGRSGLGVLVALEGENEAPRDLTGELSVRAEVGYGGGDFTVHDGAVYFLVHKTGRIYRQELRGGTARPITPASGKAASPAVSPDGKWVAYVHHDTERVDRLGVVDAEGRQWPKILAEGHDFYMQPVWAPDGRTLAWVAWDHPRMPWDGALLYVAPVLGGTHGSLPELGEPRIIAGGEDVAVFQPEFAAGGRELVFISDEGGWSHLWKVDLANDERRRLTDGEAEYGVPAWAQGMRTYALLPDGASAICARSEKGFVRAERVDLETGERQVIPELERYTEAGQLSASPDGLRIALLVAAPKVPPRIVVHDLATGVSRVVARASGENLSPAALASPEAIEWKTEDGEQAYGLFYPPASNGFEGVGPPPVVVHVHGGPTGQVRAGWNSQAQFFATRGYAVLLVNYRGSTGYGREYMLRLRRNWGVCDVQDAVSGVQHLAELDRVDAKRAAIMGGSAGGFTVLHGLVTRPEAFAAGICLFGVSNQFHLASETHKFEERYLDSLLGPLPEAAEVYRERSPVFHADRIRRPLAVFQGDIDQVVPRNQSDTIVEALRRSGTPHVYHVYEDEGHGWRKRRTIEHFFKAVDDFLKQHIVFG